ncbi:uncharacterized protein YukE [Anoxybacillus caldiproteolyticus]|uniref:Uncharacterized protein YukE n=1 Tax=Thermaerobacillus caldiproteolyticus TaxID=247480 RepID=A0A7W0BZ59_9BACL|nr:uncharacterized protein YukE [Anoxybacillus caldiproteolyticus]
MSSLLESIEKELKRRAYEAMIHCLQSYQGQVEEAIEEFQHGTRAFYRANDEYVLHWQGEAREAYEWVYGDLRQIEACIDATADELLHEISREIARIQRKDRGAIMTTIRVKPEELETVAKHVPDAEDACQRARTSLSWELPSLAMKIPGIGSAVIHELTDELLHWLQ